MKGSVSPSQDLDAKRFRLAFAGIVIVAAALYSVLSPEYQTGVFNDDAVYLMTARNLWNRDAFPTDSLTYSRPDFPFPGLPILLAPLAKLVEPNWRLAEWLSVAVTTGTLVLLGLLIRIGLTPNQTLAVLSLYALNPTVSRYSGVLMPGPYLIIAILGCLLLIRRLRESPSPLKSIGLGLVLGWGSLIRPEASLLLVTLPIGLLYHGRWKDAAAMLIIPFLSWAVFLGKRASSIWTTGSEYGGDLSALIAYWPHHLSEFFTFTVQLIDVYFSKVFAAIPVTWAVAHPHLSPVVTIIGALLTIVGAWALWQERRFDRGSLLSIGLFSIGYFFIHVFWHVTVPRYGLVLLPFVMVAVTVGMTRLLSGFPHSTRLLKSSFVLLLALYAYRDYFSIKEALWAPDPLKVLPEQSLRWIQDRMTPSERLLSTVAPSIVLYAKRYAVNVLPASNEDEFLYLLSQQRLSYIVDRRVKAIGSMDPVHDPNEVWTRIRRWIQLFPEHYAEVYENPHEKVAIYRVTIGAGFTEAYAQYLTAMKSLEHGSPENAMTALRQVVKRYPHLGSAQNALGVLDYETRTHLDESERALLNAAILLPDDSITRLNLASLYSLENQREKSTAYLQQGLQLSTKNGDRALFLKKVNALHDAKELDLPDGFPTA